MNLLQRLITDENGPLYENNCVWEVSQADTVNNWMAAYEMLTRNEPSFLPSDPRLTSTAMGMPIYCRTEKVECPETRDAREKVVEFSTRPFEGEIIK